MGEMIHHRNLRGRDNCEIANVGYVREVSAHKASMLTL